MRLQKSPSGLLGALNLKVEGRNPPEFGDLIRGTIDVYDQYLALDQFIRVEGDQVTNTSDQMFVTVPNGQQWRVHTLTASLVVPAGAVCPDGIAVSVGWSVNGTPAPLCEFAYAACDRAITPAAATVVVATWSGRHIAPAGSTFVATNQRTLGAASDIYLSMHVDRIFE